MFYFVKAIADVEKAVVESLEKQYAEVISLLKENSMNKKFGLKYVQKFTKGSPPPYNVSAEVQWIYLSLHVYNLRFSLYSFGRRLY